MAKSRIFAMSTDGNNYDILRFFTDAPTKLVKRNVSLEEARKHCERPDTMKRGKWFDGYCKSGTREYSGGKVKTKKYEG